MSVSEEEVIRIGGGGGEGGGGGGEGELWGGGVGGGGEQRAAFLAELRGRRRRLGEMTERDERREWKLEAHRSCAWLERWRLACVVCKIPHGVAFLPLSSPGPDLPQCALSTPAELRITLPKLIFHALAAAATACHGWMQRLADADLDRHLTAAHDLGVLLHLLMGANVKRVADKAVRQLEKMLTRLNKQSDLARYIRNYPTSDAGTHFLDMFYAPLLMRVHVINQFLGRPLIALDRFPVLQAWLGKALAWNLFCESLGSDFATEMIAYYKDRGSFLFNSPFVSSSPEQNHIKYVPAAFLRRQRFAVCAQAVSKQQNWEFVHAVVEVEASTLFRLASIEVRLASLTEALNSKSSAFPQLFMGIHDALGTVRPHLLENLSLDQLWQLEIETWVSLSKTESVLTRLIQGILELTAAAPATTNSSDPSPSTSSSSSSSSSSSFLRPGGGEKQESMFDEWKKDGLSVFVQALMVMISLGHDESLLKDLLQLVYRECGPSEWAQVSERVPQVRGSVITKDNWGMHYKFPVISLLCGMYSVIKARILHLHQRFCPPDVPLEADIDRSGALRSDLLEVKQLADMLEGFLRNQYQGLVSQFEFARWNDSLRAADALLAGLQAGWDVDGWPPRKIRMGWKKLKREWILGLRAQKKYLVPKMLRFVTGEALEEAQHACLMSLSPSERQLLVSQLAHHASQDELSGVFNVLRAHDAPLFDAWFKLLPRPDMLAVLDRPERLHWHPKFAGVPFILGLANRVMLEDLATMVRAAFRSLKGFGQLPHTDIRNTFEIFYHHYLSHRAILFEPVNVALGNASDGYLLLEPRVEKLEHLIREAERDVENRRARLQEVLDSARALLDDAKAFFERYEIEFVPKCVSAFTYKQSMDLFASILNTFHSSNPHLLSRTIAALKEQEEYDFFCRNVLSAPYNLLKDVLDSVRAEIPTRIWLRVTATMPTLSGVTLDSQYWHHLPLYGGLPLFWRLCHRYIEKELSNLLQSANDRAPSAQRFGALLQSVQHLIEHLEKHGTFEDVFLLPRIASAVPTIAESSFEDNSNEHSLLESNELRLIAILRSSFKSLAAQPLVVPIRQVNRLKRQLRSYQTLVLPHLIKEEEKYLPVLLHRISPQQILVLSHHLMVLYGELLSDEFLVSLFRLASEEDQKRFFCEFVPIYLKFRARGAGIGLAPDDIIFPSSEFFFLERLSLEQTALLCEKVRPKLWAGLRKAAPRLFVQQ